MYLIYQKLGNSLVPPDSVALVINPKNRRVSPQYHVVFDNNFSIILHLQKETIPTNWKLLVKNPSELATDKNYDLVQTWVEAQSGPSAAILISLMQQLYLKYPYIKRQKRKTLRIKFHSKTNLNDSLVNEEQIH
jgi:hypothetical protein